jgi:cytochrome c-type biogenesis protein CcmH/NrfG
MSESEKKGLLDRIMSEADDSAHPILQKIQEHIYKIVLVLGLVLFIAAAYSLHSFWQERKINLANAEMEAIMVQADPHARMSQLETFLDKAPDRLKGAIFLEMARTSMDMEEYEKAADSFGQLGKFDRDMRPVALLGKAKAYELMEEHGRALRTLQEESSAIPDEFQVQYLNLMSFNAERAGDYAAALDAYERLKDKVQGSEIDFIEYKIKILRQKL